MIILKFLFENLSVSSNNYHYVEIMFCNNFRKDEKSGFLQGTKRKKDY